MIDEAMNSNAADLSNGAHYNVTSFGVQHGFLESLKNLYQLVKLEVRLTLCAYPPVHPCLEHHPPEHRPRIGLSRDNPYRNDGRVTG
jgi:hypothetical protein